MSTLPHAYSKSAGCVALQDSIVAHHLSSTDLVREPSRVRPSFVRPGAWSASLVAELLPSWPPLRDIFQRHLTDVFQYPLRGHLLAPRHPNSGHGVQYSCKRNRTWLWGPRWRLGPDDCWDPDFDRVSSTAALYAGMGDLTLCLCALCLLRYRIGFRYPSIYI